MTPDEHARNAEAHLKLAEEAFGNDAVDIAMYRLGAAQVHATLSLRGARPPFVPTHEGVPGDDVTPDATDPTTGIRPYGDDE